MALPSCSDSGEVVGTTAIDESGEFGMYFVSHVEIPPFALSKVYFDGVAERQKERERGMVELLFQRVQYSPFHVQGSNNQIHWFI